MWEVHPTANVATEARIGDDVRIDAFASIGRVILGCGVRVRLHAVRADGVTIGANDEALRGAVIDDELQGGELGCEKNFEARATVMRIPARPI